MQIRDIQKKLRISINVIFSKLNEMGIEANDPSTELDENVAEQLFKELKKRRSIKVVAICKKYSLNLSKVEEILNENKIRFKNKFSSIPLKLVEKAFTDIDESQEVKEEEKNNEEKEVIRNGLSVMQIAEKLQISKVCVKKEMRNLKIEFESILEPLPKDKVDRFMKLFLKNRKRQKLSFR